MRTSIPSLGRAALHLFFLFAAAACIIPLIIVVSTSLSDELAITKEGYSLWPRSFTTIAYQFILGDPAQIARAYAVTALVAIGGTILSLAVSACLAYALSRRDFRYAGGIMLIIVFTMLFNGGLVPNYIVVTKVLGLKNSMLALVLPYLVVPWFVILLRTFFREIPYALIESAKMEGAGEFRTLFSIVLPLSTPAIATVGLFVLLMYWNDWYLSLLYIDQPNLYTLQYLLYNILQNLDAIRWNPMGNASVNLPGENARMAIAVLATAPILFAFMAVQKYFVKGLTVGAVKG